MLMETVKHLTYSRSKIFITLGIHNTYIMAQQYVSTKNFPMSTTLTLDKLRFEENIAYYLQY